MKMKNYQKPKLGIIAGAISVGLLSMGYVSQANAAVAAPIFPLTSHVSDDVTANGSGSWTYDFTVHNDTTPDFYGGGDLIVDWELPYFADMGITNIQSPTGWSHNIETIGTANPFTGWGGVADWQTDGDPWKTFFDGFYGSEAANPFNSGTQVLHWYITPQLDPCSGEICPPVLADDVFISPQGSLSGFGFDAGFAEGQAPYQASWDLNRIQTGDPAFPEGAIISLPNSPSINPVPLPGALVFFLSGLAGVIGLGKKRHAK